MPAPRRWRQADRKFKVILCCLARPGWAVGDTVSKKEKKKLTHGNRFLTGREKRKMWKTAPRIESIKTSPAKEARKGCGRREGGL